MAMPTSPADPSDTVGLQRLFNNGKFLACIADLEYTPECILAISYNADGTWQFRNSLASALVGEKCNQCQCL
ncbi:MAG: hypothetical protein M1838_006257 [Thelocarpon superellum]|nr:MAG: hypothetical protein M1838_006257 [Thelocarpon superellum]